MNQDRWLTLSTGAPVSEGAQRVAVHGAGRAEDGGLAWPRSGPVLGVAPGQLLDAPAPTRQQVEAMADRVARFRTTVLILGETGVGKEVLAQRIHRQSPRAAGPMVAINCGALCPTLIESQLFGYERGAFTGADHGKPGMFEAADGGTVFLDEVGELPLSAQAKLLRVLETRTVQRLGSTKQHALDVRFLAATNRDLDREVEAGTFRADLLFRLDGIRLRLPPLRERRDEVPGLAETFLRQVSGREGMAAPVLSPAAAEALLAYHWPGNIRELHNVIHRAVVLCDGATIEPEHLVLGRPRPSPVLAQPGGDGVVGCPVEVPRVAETGGRARAPVPLTAEVILAALDRCAGNQTRAAALLGISRGTLLNKITLFGLPRPRKAAAGSVPADAPRAPGHHASMN